MFEEVVSMLGEEDEVNIFGEVDIVDIFGEADIVNMLGEEEDSVKMLPDFPESAMLGKSLSYNLKQQNIND